MLYKALIAIFGLTPAYGASTDTPPILEPQDPSVVKEIPKKVVTFKAQDTVKDIEPKERLTRARYSVQTPIDPPPVAHHASKKAPKVSKKKPAPHETSMTSMQVRDNQEEPNKPQFIDKDPLIKTP